RDRMVEKLLNRQTVREAQCKLCTKKGEKRDALVSAELIEINAERCLLLMIYDNTERLSLENQLRQAQKMEGIGQLAAGVAHDFNNILTVIQGHVGVMLAADDLHHEMEESLRQVATASERAAGLTRQLLAFSRKQM